MNALAVVYVNAHLQDILQDAAQQRRAVMKGETAHGTART